LPIRLLKPATFCVNKFRGPQSHFPSSRQGHRAAYSRHEQRTWLHPDGNPGNADVMMILSVGGLYGWQRWQQQQRLWQTAVQVRDFLLSAR
jgi:hypothetical protein